MNSIEKQHVLKKKKNQWIPPLMFGPADYKFQSKSDRKHKTKSNNRVCKREKRIKLKKLPIIIPKVTNVRSPKTILIAEAILFSPSLSHSECYVGGRLRECWILGNRNGTGIPESEGFINQKLF
jgi:hypothetical protein